ncbi:MAG: DHH family phosphoesterase [Planctomycetota bacterium]
MDSTRELLEVLGQHQRLLVLTHQNPDPDSLASAMALRHLARESVGLESEFGFSGRIMRAENREMVRRCGIDLVDQESVEVADYDCIAVVDTQPGFGHTILPEGRRVDVIIDHHVPPEQDLDSLVVPEADVFRDVRTDVGATSTLIGNYLLEAGVSVPTEIATALVYGIKTDTADLTRNVAPLDEKVYDAFSPKADRTILRQIVSPELPPGYYRTLRVALNNVRIFGDLVLCSLGRVEAPEMVAEVADLLLRLEGRQTVLCGGLVNDVYYVSLRTERNDDAYDLLRLALGGEGSFGGHGQVAGGSVHLPDSDQRTLKRFERRLEKNILTALGLEGMTVLSLGAGD